MTNCNVVKSKRDNEISFRRKSINHIVSTRTRWDGHTKNSTTFSNTNSYHLAWNTYIIKGRCERGNARGKSIKRATSIKTYLSLSRCHHPLKPPRLPGKPSPLFGRHRPWSPYFARAQLWINTRIVSCEIGSDAFCNSHFDNLHRFSEFSSIDEVIRLKTLKAML